MSNGSHFYANEFSTSDDVFDTLNSIEFETLEDATAWLTILSAWQTDRVFEVRHYNAAANESSDTLAFVCDGTVYLPGGNDESE